MVELTSSLLLMKVHSTVLDECFSTFLSVATRLKMRIINEKNCNTKFGKLRLQICKAKNAQKSELPRESFPLPAAASHLQHLSGESWRQNKSESRREKGKFMFLLGGAEAA
jgi:hypothetical protein